jgi:electron transfer flavoprotein alpha subunit
MKILVIAEHDNHSIKASTLNTVAAGKKLDGELDVLVMGSSCADAVNEAAKISGINSVISIDGSHLENALAEETANNAADIASQYTHVFLPATTFGKNIMPRLAALLDVQPISDIIEIIDGSTYKRPIYAGSCIATVKTEQSLIIASVRTTAFDAVKIGDAGVNVTSQDPKDSLAISNFVGEELAKSDRPELTAADIIISGGRGMQSGENFSLLEGIADKLGAAVGASRAAVDSGFVPNDYQVGQTGKIVAPNLYIAVGISGAIQHLAGMKDSKVIVAINKDEDAPIFQVADYGLVADLFTALPELESLL